MCHTIHGMSRAARACMTVWRTWRVEMRMQGNLRSIGRNRTQPDRRTGAPGFGGAKLPAYPRPLQFRRMTPTTRPAALFSLPAAPSSASPEETCDMTCHMGHDLLAFDLFGNGILSQCWYMSLTVSLVPKKMVYHMKVQQGL